MFYDIEIVIEDIIPSYKPALPGLDFVFINPEGKALPPHQTWKTFMDDSPVVFCKDLSQNLIQLTKPCQLSVKDKSIPTFEFTIDEDPTGEITFDVKTQTF